MNANFEMVNCACALLSEAADILEYSQLSFCMQLLRSVLRFCLDSVFQII